MARLPRHYAPFIYGIIQSGLTTAIATAIATLQTTSLGLRFVMHWLSAWGLAWLAMLPVVVFAAPLIQRSVLALVRPDDISPDP